MTVRSLESVIVSAAFNVFKLPFSVFLGQLDDLGESDAEVRHVCTNFPHLHG
jgi:hypothetical protein